jgi:flagellar capping protein FliD
VFEIGGSFGIFDDLDLGKRDLFSIAEGNLRVGGFEDAQLLKSDLDGDGKFADFTFVDLRRGVENDKESEEKCDEVGIRDDAAVKGINAQFAVAADGSGGGPLEADGSLREAQSALLGAISYSVPGNNGFVNLQSIGISLNDDGTLSVNQGTLSTNLAGNFSSVQTFLQSSTNGFASNLDAVLTNLSDPSAGTLGLDAKSLQQSSQDLGSNIADLQASLAVKQQSLILVYSQVNATLEELPLLQRQLSQQLGTA